MKPYWRTVIRPSLVAIEARVIIEIGAAAGRMTVELLEFAAEVEGLVHVIDPAPTFDVPEFAKRFGDCLQFHEARSHDVLEQIEPAAAVLIDGDHNWYTVHGELTRLESVARREDQPFPLVMLHDVEWPYARRDLYYDPDSIPDEWRHPWGRDGIVWGRSRLSETEGINHGLAHALYEGTPRNGVLTAIDDFVKEAGTPLEVQLLPGYSGLGLLASSDLLDTAPDLLKLWDHFASAEFLREHARQLALTATQADAAGTKLRHELRRISGKLDHALVELQAARADLAAASSET